MTISRFGHRLARATPLLALMGPFVIFGFLYVLAVEPQRAAVRETREQAATLRTELDRARGLVRNNSAQMTGPGAISEFERRTPDGDRTFDVAAAIIGLANSPA